ncbi:hypothetical protein CG709_20370, partial [Lachnotalea glycerini]
MKIREYIKDKPLIFDGAMGTYYSEQQEGKCELANINNRERIIEIHRKYIAAGCVAIKTNTFAANTISLEKDLELVKRVIAAGAQNAIQATDGREIFIFGDMGPIPYAG